MTGDERFEKCCVLITKNCKLWILKFAKNRIQQDHNGQTLKQFIESSYNLSSNAIVKDALSITSDSDIDIAALCVVIQTGKLLRDGEEKSVEHQHNTIGDQVDRIRQMRNTLVHTEKANLDKIDYDDYIHNIKDIGKWFEGINGEANGTYTGQIEEIHDTSFDSS